MRFITIFVTLVRKKSYHRFCWRDAEPLHDRPSTHIIRSDAELLVDDLTVVVSGSEADVVSIFRVELCSVRKVGHKEVEERTEDRT